MTQFRGRRRQPLAPAVGPGILDSEILTFDEACFGESLAQLVNQELGPGCRGVPQKPDHRHCRLLRARGERPRGRAAKKRDELAPPHSITSSASASTLSGMMIPSVLAVLRLMENWKRVGCSALTRCFEHLDATAQRLSCRLQVPAVGFGVGIVGVDKEGERI